MIVVATRTPIELNELLVDLDAAGHQVLATCPGVDRLAVAWGQLVLEHGVDAPQVGVARSLRAIYCYNFGNRDAPSACATDPAIAVYVTVPECEGEQCAWRATHLRYAYEDAYAGAVAWWRSMVERWDAVSVMASPEAFAAQLKSKGYYTGSEAAYARAVAALADEARRRWADLHA